MSIESLYRICSIHGCEEPHYGRGYCRTHWRRWHKTGSPLRARKSRSVCAVPGCSRPVACVSSGLCMTHYQRERRRRLRDAIR